MLKTLTLACAAAAVALPAAAQVYGTAASGYPGGAASSPINTGRTAEIPHGPYYTNMPMLPGGPGQTQGSGAGYDSAVSNPVHPGFRGGVPQGPYHTNMPSLPVEPNGGAGGGTNGSPGGNVASPPNFDRSARIPQGPYHTNMPMLPGGPNGQGDVHTMNGYGAGAAQTSGARNGAQQNSTAGRGPAWGRRLGR